MPEDRCSQGEGGSSWRLGTDGLSTALQEWIGFRWWEGKRKATPCTEKVTPPGSLDPKFPVEGQQRRLEI